MKHLTAIATLAAPLLIAGCSRLPAGPSRPALDASAAARQAIEACDTNSDGRIDAQEVEQAPGLREAFDRIDEDGDAALTADEIERRVGSYRSSDTIMISGAVEVRYGGRPLPGALITFEPEGFLGDGFAACSGTTDEEGFASVEAPDAEFPGLYLGMYRVRITRPVNGKELLPPRYNSETTLGYEAAVDAVKGFGGIQFDLSRK